MKRPVLYRVYDTNDRLIYIGSTVNLTQRMAGHRAASWWTSLVARIDVEPHDSISTARRAEVRAIASEKPAFNQQHTGRLSVQTMRLTDHEVRVCREWLAGGTGLSRRAYLPYPLRWVRAA